MNKWLAIRLFCHSGGANITAQIALLQIDSFEALSVPLLTYFAIFDKTFFRLRRRTRRHPLKREREEEEEGARKK